MDENIIWINETYEIKKKKQQPWLFVQRYQDEEVSH